MPMINRINALIISELPDLPPHLRIWVEQHMIFPRQESFSLTFDGKGEIILWLVTDNIGEKDSSCRIVFDEAKGWFGFVMSMQNKVEWFMGLNGSLVDTVYAM